MLVTVRCAACGEATLGGATTVMQQSQRWPTIFLHAYCRSRLWNVAENQNWLDIPVIKEVTTYDRGVK